MQPALWEEKATFGNNLERNCEKRPTNKQTNGRTATKSVTWWNSASVRVSHVRKGTVGVWANKSELKRKKNHLKLHQKTQQQGFLGDGVDDRKNERHQWRPSASVESWSPGGLTAVCDFSAQPWKLKARDQEASLQWTVRTASDEPQRSLASQARQALADQTKAFQPLKEGRTFATHRGKKNKTKGFHPEQLQSHLMSSILAISNFISMYSIFYLGQKVTLSNILNMNTEQVWHADHWPKNSWKVTTSLADVDGCIPTTHLLGFGFFFQTMHAFILEK